MKKLFFALALVFSFALTKAQSCASPIGIDSLNGQFTAIDSFNVQNRFFKFTANNPQHTIKVYVNRLSAFGGNVTLNLYSNNCSNLSASQLTINPTISGDTLIVDYSSFIQGFEYLIEINKVVNNSTYVVHSISLNNGMSVFVANCGSCTSTNTVCDLVCNGSFECMATASTTWNTSGMTDAFNWTSATLSSPDIMSSTTFTPYNVPCNAFGSETGHTGNNYAGLIFKNGGYCEYLETELVSTMQANKKYTISFWVSKAEIPTAPVNAIAIYLTSGLVSLSTFTDISTTAYTPDATYTGGTFLNTTSGWNKITFCYTAVGNENYLTIGRPPGFPGTTGTTPVAGCSIVDNLLAGPMDLYSYLYIDDVSVKLFEVNAGSTQTVNVCGTAILNSNFTCGSPTVDLNPINYSWSGTNGFTSSSPNTVSNVTTTTNFNITVTGFDSNNQSCAATGTLAVTSNTLNPLTLSSSVVTVCPNSPVTITGALTGGTGSYTFSPGNLVGNNLVFNPSVTTTYTVSGTAVVGGCIQTKTITIYTFTNGIGVTASPNSICNGFSSTLTASNGSSFTWQPGSSSGTSIIVSPIATTIYTVTGTSLDGCLKTNTITVTVNNPSSINISPSSTNSICLNSSINLTASGAVTYTWQAGNVIASNINVTPLVNTTYTVFGTNAFGCIGSQTATIFINPLPTVICSLTTPTICPNVATLLNASGANTYTWFPGNIINANAVVSPSVNTTYTVLGTSVLGCTANCIVLQSVYPPNIFTVTATPSVVCGSTGGGPSTLIATPNAPSTYTWLPSNTASYSLAVTSTSISSPVYTVVSTNSLGCIGSYTIKIEVSDGYAALNLLPDYCQTTTLNLANGIIATPYPGGTFSVNGVPSGTLFSQPPGSYTIAFTNTTALLCDQTATMSIQVFSVPITPTITGSSSSICGGQSLTLTANPSAPSYSWSNSTFTSNPYVFTPTTQVNYTVMAINGPCSAVSPEFSFNFNPLPCNCVQNCVATLSSTYNVSPAANQVYCVDNHLFINGNVTILNCDLKIAPNVSITVLPSSTLTISGCHLYACDNMWRGIIVQQGGKLNIIPSSASRTSFIEDAFVAVDILTAFSYTATNILNIDNVTFNRNQIGVRINDYSTSQNNYPFSIKNSLFTSRTITFTPLTYPSTNAIKNSASGNTSALQTPYVTNTIYIPTGIKSPFATGTYPDNGIVLNTVGYTNSNGNGWWGIVIGNANNVNDFNCFDYLKEDITAYNTNVKIMNNVFQNGVTFRRKPTSGGGKAIVANSVNGPDAKGPANNQIQIISVGTNTVITNRFYEKTACADITNYINVEIKNARAYSFANNYNLLNTLNPIGDRGFNVKTNRYFTITMQNNKIYNIKNAMLISIDNGLYFVGQQAGYGRLVGNIIVTNNLVDRHPTIATSAEFVNIGLSLADPFTSAFTQINSSNSSSNLISGNRFLNVHNGIAINNVAFSVVNVTTNTITIVNEPTNYVPLPVQNGIVANQLGNTLISLNNISGFLGNTNDISAVKTSMNQQLAVRCNTTKNTYHGLNFNASQAITSVEDNILENQKYGISLTNTATIGQQGSFIWPTNNQWLNWTSGFKTMNQDIYSSAQNSKMYVKWGNVNLDPNGSSVITGTIGQAQVDDYFHSPPNNQNTILNSPPNFPVGCRLGTSTINITGLITNAQKILLENLTTNATPAGTIAAQTRMIDKNRVYQTLRSNTSYTTSSAILTTFYSNALTSVMEKFAAIENDIALVNNAAAQSKVATLSNTNAIEANYKTFYTVYFKTKDSTYASGDSLNLINLANSCPYTDGGVVYQARALYNTIYDTYINFIDNCNIGVGNRLFDNVVNSSETKEINVILKSKLYPNPNDGEFNISVTGLKEDRKIEVYIFDVAGKLVLQETSFAIEDVINIKPELLNGTYLVKIKLPDGTVDIHRLIISK